MPMITDFRYPGLDFAEFVKYRLTYQGGRAFINAYLKKFDNLETNLEFANRAELTYCPSFAEEGIKEITDAIFPRMADIIRTGGTPSYHKAIAGEEGGVDLKFNSMDTFMGKEVFPEAAVLGKVGIYVDMPAFNPEDTLAQHPVSPHPYCYTYTAEQILSWNVTLMDNELVYTTVLIKDCFFGYDEDTGLPTEAQERFRLLQLKADGVHITFLERFTEKSTGKIQERVIDVLHLPGLTRIPLVIVDFKYSFLKNISDYQIVLLNIESSDIQYILKANFPFYVEQYSPLSEGAFQKQTKIDVDSATGETKAVPGNQANAEVITGATKGRRYPIGADAPQFIHPSPEPLQASAAKQAQIKEDIRRLMNLAVSNVAPTRASAESKQVDQAGLEAGLAAIGIALESAERQIARIWAEYENTKIKLVIKYPSVYSTKSDEQRTKDAKEIGELKTLAPSQTFNKEISKMAARSILSGKVPQEVLKTVDSEIDAANYTTNDYKAISSDVEAGLVDKVTASNARGYDGKTVVPIAEKEHAQRLAEIAKSQSLPGVPDTKPTPAPVGRGDGK